MDEIQLCERVLASLKYFCEDAPMPSALHDAAMKRYRQYLVTGGMPECVLQFAETQDYILVQHTQDTILSSYLNDMSKYNNLNEIKKTRLVYDNITVQLSKKNTRFQYKLIKKGGRLNLKMRLSGSACRGSCRRFTKWNRSKSRLKIIVILTRSADNTKAKSLRVYMETYHPDYAIKLSAKNFGFKDRKKTVPLYAAFCI